MSIFNNGGSGDSWPAPHDPWPEPINHEPYFYISDRQGKALCNTHFTTYEEAVRYFKKSFHMQSFACFICKRSSNVLDEVIR